MKCEKKIHAKKRSSFFKRKKKSLKYEFKLKAKFFFIRFIHYIIILNIFKNADIFLQEIIGLFFYLSLYFYAIILINLHGRMKCEKKIHAKKRSSFFKRKKKSLKYEFKLKAKFFFIRFIHYIIILNIFKNADIFLQEIIGLFFYLSLYFYAIILNKYYTHILSFTYYIV